jgi:hypothetical protein
MRKAANGRITFIGLGDFSLFAGLYGTTYFYASGVSRAVPEPLSVALVGLAAVRLIASRQR